MLASSCFFVIVVVAAAAAAAVVSSSFSSSSSSLKFISNAKLLFLCAQWFICLVYFAHCYVVFCLLVDRSLELEAAV